MTEILAAPKDYCFRRDEIEDIVEEVRKIGARIRSEAEAAYRKKDQVSKPNLRSMQHKEMLM